MSTSRDDRIRFAAALEGARQSGYVKQAVARHSGDWPSNRTTAPAALPIAAGHTGHLAAELSALYGRSRLETVMVITRTEKAGQDC